MALLDWVLGAWLETIHSHPDVKAVDRDLAKRNFGQVLSYYKSLKNDEEREWIVHWLADKTGRPSYFDDFVDAYPNESLPYLLRGSHGVCWAWEARTAYKSEHVSEKQFKTFFRRLVAARVDLHEAAELDKSDPTPFGALISCAMGLESEKSTVEESLKHARRLSKTAWRPHAATLQYLCQKWCGSHEQMFKFGRTVSGKSPAGSGLGTLVAIAHIERFFFAKNFTKDEKQFARQYWSNADVANDILQAYNHSLGSSEFRETILSGWQRNFFAYALGMIGASEPAAHEFIEIGRSPTKYPWAMFGHPTTTYIKMKRKFS